MRLATYNIHGCIGGDRRFDPGRILDVLKELDADVLALQEVESRDDGEPDPLRLFARELGCHVIRGPTLVRAGGAYGNALLSRRPVHAFERLDLTVAGREPRGAIDARVSDHGEGIRVIATHLGLRPAERRQQIRRLLHRLGGRDAPPAVLMGDLNEWFFWGRPLRYLRRFFARMPAYRTYPARWPALALDRIWVHPPERLLAVNVPRTAATRLASDHLPVVATIATGTTASPDRARGQTMTRRRSRPDASMPRTPRFFRAPALVLAIGSFAWLAIGTTLWLII